MTNNQLNENENCIASPLTQKDDIQHSSLRAKQSRLHKIAFAFIIAMLLTLTALIAFGGLSNQNRIQTVYANPINNVQYIDANGNMQTANNVTVWTNASIGTIAASRTLNSGWHIFTGNATITSFNGIGLIVNGTVNLILADSSNWNIASGGFRVNYGNTLNIFAQSTGDNIGRLISTASGNVAAIGSNTTINAGNIAINGGIITATGTTHGAAIGGGANGNAGNITIRGGFVTARFDVSTSAAAIGGGGGTGAVNSGGGVITITGGTVYALGGPTSISTGIGSGRGNDGALGTLTIDGDALVRVGGGSIDLGGMRANTNIVRGILIHSFATSTGTVHGDVVLPSNLTIRSTPLETLTVPQASTLRVPSGVSLIADSGGGTRIINNGTIIPENGSTVAINGTRTGNLIQGANVSATVTIGNVTANSITINAPNANRQILATTGQTVAAMQFGLGTTNNANSVINWQTGLTFNNLLTQRQYFVFARSGATTHFAAGTPTESLAQATTLTAPIAYLDHNGNPQTVALFTRLALGHRTLTNGGWYVIGGTLTGATTRFTVAENGTANIIIEDNAVWNLTGSSGIGVPVGTTINIFSQSFGSNMGSLTMASAANAAVIGGASNNSAGTININGGRITAINTQANNGAAAIGGGNNGNGGNITINNGYIVVNSRPTTGTGANQGGAGIGGGRHGNSGNITINGGTVTATGALWAAAIGGGLVGDAENITITGGVVNAFSSISGTSPAGIGGGGGGAEQGQGGAGGNITISGGKVRVMDGTTFRPIGTGGAGANQGASGAFTLNGNAIVVASSISSGTNLTQTQGIFFSGLPTAQIGTVFGAVILEHNLEIFEGNTNLNRNLTIPNGTSLTIPSGRTLTNNNHTITVANGGSLITNAGGSLVNNGGTVTVQNGGSFITNAGGSLVNHGTVIPEADSTVTLAGSLTGNLINGSPVGGTGAAPIAAQTTQISITLAAGRTVAANTGQTVLQFGRSYTNNAAAVTNWQTGRTFTGLTANTQYFFFVRTGGTANFAAGTPVALGNATTLQHTFTVTPDFTNITPETHTPLLTWGGTASGTVIMLREQNNLPAGIDVGFGGGAGTVGHITFVDNRPPGSPAIENVAGSVRLMRLVGYTVNFTFNFPAIPFPIRGVDLIITGNASAGVTHDLPYTVYQTATELVVTLFDVPAYAEVSFDAFGNGVWNQQNQTATFIFEPGTFNMTFTIMISHTFAATPNPIIITEDNESLIQQMTWQGGAGEVTISETILPSGIGVSVSGTTLTFTDNRPPGSPALNNISASIWLVRSGTTYLVNVNITRPAVGNVISITGQPTATTDFTFGQISGNLSVTASVTQGATLNFQWQRQEGANWANIDGANSATFSIPSNLAVGTHNFRVRIMATDADTVYSNIAAVVVGLIPTPNAPTFPTAVVWTSGMTLNSAFPLTGGWSWVNGGQTLSANATAQTFYANFNLANHESASNVQIQVTVNPAATPATPTPSAVVFTAGMTLATAFPLTGGWTWAEPTTVLGIGANQTFYANFSLANHESATNVPIFITVNEHIVPPTGIEIVQDDYEFYYGTHTTIQLTYTIAPNNANYDGVTWGSDNELVATVDGNGLVTIHGVGTARITVTVNDTTFSAFVDITVNEYIPATRTVAVSITGTGAEGVTSNAPTTTLQTATQLVVTLTGVAADATVTATGGGVWNATLGTVTFTFATGAEALNFTITVTAYVIIPTEYTITFNANNGTMPSDMPTHFEYGVGLATLPTPTRTGYTFGGWFDNAALTGTAVTSILATHSGNVTLWARWTANETQPHPNHTAAQNAINALITAIQGTDANAIEASLTTMNTALEADGVVIADLTFGTHANAATLRTAANARIEYLNDTGGGGLSGGAIAGIVLGSLAVLLGGGFAVYWFVLRKKGIRFPFDKEKSKGAE